MAEFMGHLQATDFNVHNSNILHTTSPPLSPPYSLHTNRRKITHLHRKEKEREKVYEFESQRVER